MTMIPPLGKLVLYTLTATDAEPQDDYTATVERVPGRWIWLPEA